MSMREEFLFWVSKRKLVTRNKASLRMNGDESQFLDYRVNDLWCAWQASRAGLVVDLGQRLREVDYEPAVEDDDGELLYYHNVVEALESAGVAVKS